MAENVWNDMSVVYLGRTLTGIQEATYEETTEKEYVYGAGNKPLGIQTGNKKVEGKMVLLQSEVEALFDAVKAIDPALSVTDISADIVINFGEGDLAKTKIIKSVEFSKYNYGMKQEDKFMAIELPFMALEVVHA